MSTNTDPTVSEQDSQIIYEMVRQIPKGVWRRSVLRKKLYETKGAKPTHVPVGQILDHVDAAGSRWGIVALDGGDYSVWGGQRSKREWEKVEITTQQAADSIYEDIVALALQRIGKRTLKYGSFKQYLGKTFKAMRLHRMPVSEIARGVASGRIRSSVVVKKIDGILWVDIK